MSTTKHPFRKLSVPPIQAGHYSPKPLFYPRSSNDIIISTNADVHMNSSGIYKYNISTNELELIHKYAKCAAYHSYHGQFIDYKNEILYLVGGDYQTFNAFNLKKKEMINMGSNNS
eukprot:370021_1